MDAAEFDKERKKLGITHMEQIEDVVPKLVSALEPHFISHSDSSLGELVNRVAAQLRPELLKYIDDAMSKYKAQGHKVFIPSMEVFALPPDVEMMPFSTCSGRDFLHPKYIEICKRLKIPLIFHRKCWEWVYIYHHLTERIARSSARGLGFGVGTEALPAGFALAGHHVLATDAPVNIGISSGWLQTDQFAQGRELLTWKGIIESDAFNERVSFQVCDMNAIPETLTNFDFCWSSCCLEHLGSLQAGIDFIINSVEKTLRVGGWACHTTEFNLSSNDATVETGATVIYRRRDLEAIISQLRERGHEVLPLRIAPDSLEVDGYVDTPPYSAPQHLKLDLYGYVATSVALLIRRGR